MNASAASAGDTIIIRRSERLRRCSSGVMSESPEAMTNSQPPDPLLTPPAAVEYLFQQIPFEPGRHHPLARCDRSTGPAAAAAPPQTTSRHGTVPADRPSSAHRADRTDALTERRWVQADHPVIGLQGPAPGPARRDRPRRTAVTATDRTDRAGIRRHKLVAESVHQSGDGMLKHHPGGDPAAVTAQRMRRIGLRLLSLHRGELDPDGARTTKMAVQARDRTPSVTKRRELR